MPPAASPKPPLIVVHVHYPDVWEEMARDLAQAFDRPFGLVLTHGGGAPLARPDTLHLAYAREIAVENRGRDVRPFLVALGADLPAFDIGLKLHTKRSPHRDDGAQWRRFVTGSLLAHDPATDDGPAALALMEAQPALGLIAPQGHLLPLMGRLALNERPMLRMLSALGLDAPDVDALNVDVPSLDVLSPETPVAALEAGRFAASTMFWFRREALAPFRLPALDGLFETENAQLDGTAAHAAERLFAHVCERRGYVASAMEAAPAIREAARADGPLEAGALRALTEAALGRAENPFSIPMAAFWSRHRKLLRLAHLTYNHIPTPVWLAARRLIRRCSGRA